MSNPGPLARCARAVLAVTILALAGTATAQTPADAESATPKTGEEARPAPTAIPLVDVAAESESVAELARQVEKELEERVAAAPVEAELPRLAQAIDQRQSQSAALLQDNPTLDQLREAEGAWRALRTRLDPLANGLAARIAELDARLAEIERLEVRWRLTREQAQSADAPPAVAQGIARTLDELSGAQQQVARYRSDLLALQARVSSEAARISAELSRIQRRRDAVFTALFTRSVPPLWERNMLARSRAEMGEDLRRSLATDGQQIAEFVRQRTGDVAAHAGVFLMLYLALRSARRRLSGLGDAEVPSSLHVVHHPLSLAFLLALLPMGWLYPEMPLLLGWLVFVAALPGLVIITRDYTDASLRPLLYALGGFLLLDLLREIIAPLAAASRVAFVAEMLLVLTFIAWLLRPARLNHLPGGEQLRGLELAGVAARGAFAICLVAALLEIVGYQRLARLMGEAVLRSAYVALLLYAAVQAFHGLAAFLMRRRPLRTLHMVSRHRLRIERALARLLAVAAVLLWGWSVLDALALRRAFGSGAAAAFAANLEVGEVDVSLGDVLIFGLAIWLSFRLARMVRFVLDEEVFTRVPLARGLPYAISTLVGYAVLFVGFLFAVAAAGVDLTRFTILAGAFGVGIGFGLQNVVNNFVSGLILLFERPVQVGDTLQLDDVSGEVRRIGIRASTIRTWEGADVVVPNGDLISQRVTNWTLADRNRRIDLQVGVAYGSDPRAVIELLGGVAEASSDLLSYPAPQALFTGFGESSLDFVLRVWTGQAERWVAIRSDLALAVHDALREGGIEIPFPQRDVHLKPPPAGR